MPSRTPRPAPPRPAAAADLDDAGKQVLRQFRQVYNAVRTHFQKVEKIVGLGGSMVWALSLVRDRPGIGVRGLAEAMAVHQSTASNLVRGLLDRQLISAAKDGPDRRTVQLRLLPAGAKLLRGMPGTYTRLTGEADWRRSFTDDWGEIWTPFASVRADAIDASVTNQPGVSNFLPTGDTQAMRVMPTVGLEYRYPFINVQPWGSTTVEPIVQVIARPNEPDAGKLPNEDAQSMVFDTSNLFSVDKFSGYDREEGGGRANVGAQVTTQFNQGGSVVAVFGQSYQLFGLNSFAVADATNTGIDSGLDKPASDYVASIAYSPNRTWTFTTRSRFDEATGNVDRFEAEGKATFDRWSVSLLYGDYAPQPDIGYLTRREGVLATGSVKVASNWVVTGAARWDLVANQINQYVIGAGYVDDCFVLGMNYVTSYTYVAGNTPPTLSHAFMLQLGLRTIAQTSTTTGGGTVQ